MSAAHRRNQRGTYMIDRAFKNIGRIRRASGATDLATHERIAGANLRSIPVVERTDMLSVIYHNQPQNHWVLEGIKDGLYTAVYAYGKWVRGELDRLSRPEAIVPLSHVADWIRARKKAGDVSAVHCRDVLHSLKHLSALDKNAAVGDLPRLLRRFKQENMGHPTKVNHARAHISSYLSDTLGSNHTLTLQVRDIKPLKSRPRLQHYISVEQARRVLKEFRYGAEFWSMCVTGMGPKEYWVDGFELDARWVQINGEKREGRVRLVPHVGSVVKPGCSLSWFTKRLKEYDESLTPRVPRHSYGRWLEDAGVVQSNIDAYLGHGASSVRDTYQRRKMAREIPGDTEKLAAYLGEPQGLRVAK